jgi:hypothetical protein
MDVAEWAWHFPRFGGRLPFSIAATAMRAGFENGRAGVERCLYRRPACGML